MLIFWWRPCASAMDGFDGGHSARKHHLQAWDSSPRRLVKPPPRGTSLDVLGHPHNINGSDSYTRADSTAVTTTCEANAALITITPASSPSSSFPCALIERLNPRCDLSMLCGSDTPARCCMQCVTSRVTRDQCIDINLDFHHSSPCSIFFLLRKGSFFRQTNH